MRDLRASFLFDSLIPSSRLTAIGCVLKPQQEGIHSTNKSSRSLFLLVAARRTNIFLISPSPAASKIYTMMQDDENDDTAGGAQQLSSSLLPTSSTSNGDDANDERNIHHQPQRGSTRGGRGQVSAVSSSAMDYLRGAAAGCVNAIRTTTTGGGGGGRNLVVVAEDSLVLNGGGGTAGAVPLLLVEEEIGDDLRLTSFHPSQPSTPGVSPTPHPPQLLRSSTSRVMDMVGMNNPDNRRKARRFVGKMGDYLAYATLLVMLVLIPYVLYNALSNKAVDLAAWNSAGVMTCGTVIISLRLVYLHLTHWYMPDVQKYVVRILFMVPIYSIQSFLSLRFHNLRIYIDAIRDFYEAFVIASFVYYLIELLGGQDSLVQILLQKTNTQLGKHPWPLSKVLYQWELGVEFMLQCKHGVLQYVVFKSVAAVLTYFFGIVGMYGEGQFNWFVAYPYLCFFQNISVMYALYCLVMLYSAIKEELEHPVNWHPLGKFLCIKGVGKLVPVLLLRDFLFFRPGAKPSGDESFLINSNSLYIVLFPPSPTTTTKFSLRGGRV